MGRHKGRVMDKSILNRPLDGSGIDGHHSTPPGIGDAPWGCSSGRRLPRDPGTQAALSQPRDAQAELAPAWAGAGIRFSKLRLFNN